MKRFTLENLRKVYDEIGMIIRLWSDNPNYYTEE